MQFKFGIQKFLDFSYKHFVHTKNYQHIRPYINGT